MPVFSADDFARALAGLLPTGRAWPRDQDATLPTVTAALAPSYARNAARAENLLVDAFPGTVGELLPEWEATLGLPDPCAGETPSVERRQAQVAARFAADGGQSAAYYVRLAAALGYDITIGEFAPARFGRTRFGARFQGVGWAHVWAVNAPLESVAQAHFGAARFGDRYAWWGNAVLECEIGKAAPAHSKVLFRYSPQSFDLTAGIPAELTFARASAATYFDAVGMLQSAAAGVSRQDHHPVALSPLGTLLEPGAVNLVRYSGDISNAAWVKFGSPTVTANAALAPDGTTTAASVLLSPSSGFYQRGTTAGGQTCTGSIWLRADTPITLRQAATDGVSSPILASINVTTTWRRFALTRTSDVTSTYVALQIDGTGGGGLVYAWGGQVELGAAASSYIPTTSAAASRAADALSLPLPYDGFSSPDGWTAILEFAPAALPGGVAALGLAGPAGFDDTTYAQIAADGTVTAIKRVGGQVAVSPVAGTVAIGKVSRLVLSQGASGAKLSLNGAPPVVAVLPGYPIMSRVAIAGSPWGAPSTTQPMWARGLRLRPRELSDAEMMSAVVQ